MIVGWGAGLMTTCDVDAIGCMSTGIVSPWIAACSMCSRTGWVGDASAKVQKVCKGLARAMSVARAED